MTHSALASRYASALVDVATSLQLRRGPQQVRANCASLRKSSPVPPELRNALMSPSVPRLANAP